MSDYDIAEAFQRIEEELIASMRRNMAHHRALETAEGLNYTQWQAEQLQAFQEYRLRNERLFSEYYSTINAQIEAGLADTYRFGRMRQERAILTALKNGARLPRKPTAALQQSFFRLNERKLNALIKSVTSDMKRAESAVLRFCDDQYRKAIFNAQVYLNSGAGTLEQSVDMATRDFLSQGISCIEYRNGARVPIDAYAKMALRTANTRAYLMGEASMRDEWGISTVIVNKRGVACPKCLNYVGRVFYDDVYGSAPIPKDGKYPLLSSAIAGGLYHPNCKDIHTTYFEGISTPPNPPTEAQKQEAERVYKLEQEQRYNERHIRKYKRLRDGSLDPDNRRKYADKLTQWQDRQKRFIAENGDVLKRRYENEVVMEMRVSEPPKLRKPLAKPAEGGIIELHRRKGTHRKVSKSGRQIIDKPTYHKIVNPAIRSGANIVVADTPELRAHLANNNASAACFGDVIIFSEEATVSDVLEEVFHFYQGKARRFSQYGIRQREIMLEIEAKEYLLSVAEKYHIPAEETALTEAQLKEYRRLMEEMKKRGEWDD